MARMIGRATDRDYLEMFQRYCDNFRNATPVNTRETQGERIARKTKLEKDPEAWFKYYFPHYCSAEPAAFHKAATRRLLSHPEWFEVRAWSRELAKSARSMMEFCFLALTGKVHNLLMVSNSHDNAVLLLAPFKAFFEANNRVEQDYGIQKNIGQWTEDKFVIRAGCSFRALGWGESPRGTRNNEKRPDAILIDDFDTDEECRNEDTMKKKIAWMEQALIPTRSISSPTRVLVNGNIISDNCMVKYLGDSDFCDKFDVVNIRNKDGKSSWPEKNSEEDIDRVLKTISYASGQKEYFNNPMDEGGVFTDLKDGKIPSLKRCMSIIYADPATSNKDVSQGSYKAIGVILKKDLDFYIAKVKVDTMSTQHFVESLFDLYQWGKYHGAEDLHVYIENNSLQAPFFEQVLQPAIFKESQKRGELLPVIPDTRDKKDKYTRIEGTLEPINRAGLLIFNEAEAEDPDMRRLKSQFKAFSPKQKRMDGPDMIEGGVFILQQKASVLASAGIVSIPRTNRKKI
ncbi:MAG: hypothetical protein IKN59_07755 [Paludibacteraceae bacterium]|nr:hypothetical protein [Paludibacteraceae bacterium]